MIPLLETPQAGRYACLYADPPWRYAMRSDLGRAKAPDAHYETMDLSAIAALPVAEVAGPRCFLFLWTTWAFLAAGHAHELVLDGWNDPENPWRGVSGGSWHKMTEKGKATFGSGYLFRTSSEPLLVFVRGDPRWLSKSERNSWSGGVGFEALRREHSRKPDPVRAMIERATAGPRLEMFTRSDAPGWDAWGDQAGLFNDPEAVAALKAEKAARKARRACQLELGL